MSTVDIPVDIRKHKRCNVWKLYTIKEKNTNPGSKHKEPVYVLFCLLSANGVRSRTQKPGAIIPNRSICFLYLKTLVLRSSYDGRPEDVRLRLIRVTSEV
jgi:hypothetical protein